MSKNKQGFTLVELIVVITILAILGTIAFISLGGYSKTARDSRRISDIANIKTSLELFTLNTGYYPQPDVVGSGAVYYSGDLLWTQGTVGDNVARNLSRNLSKKPLDPLFDIEYTYSLVNTNNEYQLMAIYEGEVSINNLLNISYAANTYNTKVEGTFNELFIETPNYIVPVPSLITSEPTPFDLEADAEKIESMVVTNGTNFPNLNIPNTTTQTGGLTGLVLSPFTGSLTKNSTPQDKINLVIAIQGTYIGSNLATKGSYKTILNTTEPEILVDRLFLNSYNTITTLILVNGLCGADDGGSFTITPINLCTTGNSSIVTDGGEGNNYTWSCNGENLGTNDSCSAVHSLTPINGLCGADDGGSFTITPINLCTTGNSSIVTDGGEGNNYTWSCDGQNGGTNDSCSAVHEGLCNAPDIQYGSYIISACNLGTSISGTGPSSYGHYFQFGRNISYENGAFTGGLSSIGYDWEVNGRIDGTDDGSANYWGVIDSQRLTAIYANSTAENKTKMQGPCPENYHVPTKKEWDGLLVAWGGNLSNGGAQLVTDLLLPLAGSRNAISGVVGNQGSKGDYWSSSPNATKTYHLQNYLGSIFLSSNQNRALGYPIRCFKN